MGNLDLETHIQQLGNSTIRYPTDGLAQAETDFRRRYPEYEQTTRLDELRATDYTRLDQQDHVYLDYTGGGLYAESQVRAHTELLNSIVLGIVSNFRDVYRFMQFAETFVDQPAQKAVP